MMRPAPEPRVAAFLDAIELEGLGLASITVWEILDGIGRLAPGRPREHLSSRFHDLFDELFEDRIVPWSLADARECARIMDAKRRRGSRCTPMSPTRSWPPRPPHAGSASSPGTWASFATLGSGPSTHGRPISRRPPGPRPARSPIRPVERDQHAGERNDLQALAPDAPSRWAYANSEGRLLDYPVPGSYAWCPYELKDAIGVRSCAGRSR